MSAKVTLAILFESKPECFGELLNALTTLAANVLAEDGCEYFKLYRVLGEDNALYVHEQWASQEAFEAHRATNGSSALNDRLGEWLCRPPAHHALAALHEA